MDMLYEMKCYSWVNTLQEVKFYYLFFKQQKFINGQTLGKRQQSLLLAKIKC